MDSRVGQRPVARATAVATAAPTGADLARCRDLQTQDADLLLGVVDATIVALAERVGEPKVATLDQLQPDWAARSASSSRETGAPHIAITAAEAIPPTVAHHTGMHQPILTGPQRAFLAAARRAVLATIAADGHARLVPICFVVDDQPDEAGHPIAWSPLDDKPKAVADPRDLARIRDVRTRPGVTLLVDNWEEDWTRLGWLRCVGTARLVEPGELSTEAHCRVIEALRAKHPQYRDHDLESRPLIRITIERAVAWGDLSGSKPLRRQ